MNLFQHGDFTLSGGDSSHFKIECEALTEADWDCLARLLAERLPPFGGVIGVPTGGLLLAEAMVEYTGYSGTLLIVDDVLTTGGSMERMRKVQSWQEIIGAVVFARKPPPLWITPLFTLTPKLRPR